MEFKGVEKTHRLFIGNGETDLNDEFFATDEFGLHVVEKGLGENPHVFYLDGLHDDAPLLGDILQLLLQLQDDGSTFAEYLFDGYVGNHMTPRHPSGSHSPAPSSRCPA